MKKAVHGRQPSNLVDLEQICQDEWVKITPERTQKLLKAYPERLEAVIKAKEGHMKY